MGPDMVRPRGGGGGSARQQVLLGDATMAPTQRRWATAHGGWPYGQGREEGGRPVGRGTVSGDAVNGIQIHSTIQTASNDFQKPFKPYSIQIGPTLAQKI
jgi:hypothetical protein